MSRVLDQVGRYRWFEAGWERRADQRLSAAYALGMYPWGQPIHATCAGAKWCSDCYERSKMHREYHRRRR